MEDVDVESFRRYLLEHTDLATRFPNWSSSALNLSIIHDLLKDGQGQLSEELQLLDAVSAQFKHYYLWVILALGLPGNVASLLTFLHMRSLGSCVVYVAVLAVVDSLALVGKLTLLLLQRQRYSFTPESCKALLFLVNAAVTYANWIVVALAAERLFAVCRPLALSVYWTRSRAGGVLAALMLTSLLVCFPVVVVSVPTNDTMSCVLAPQHRRTAQAWHWVNATMYGFLPCLVLLTANVAIISMLRRARRKQLQLCPGRDQPSARCGGSQSARRLTGDTQRQASFILLVASFVLIVLTIPRCALLLLQQLWRPRDVVVIARVRVLNQVTFALSDLNHAINFYLYFLSARHFRRRFFDLFRCTSRRLRRLSTRETVEQQRISSSGSFQLVQCALYRPDNLVGKGDRWQAVRMRTDTC